MEHAFIGYFLWQTIKLPEGNGSKKPSTSVTKYRKPVYIGYTYQGYPRLPKDETIVFWSQTVDINLGLQDDSLRDFTVSWVFVGWDRMETPCLCFFSWFLWYVSEVSPAFFWDFPTRERGIFPHPQLAISTPPTPGRVKLFVGGIAKTSGYFSP